MKLKGPIALNAVLIVGVVGSGVAVELKRGRGGSVVEALAYISSDLGEAEVLEARARLVG